MQSYRQQQKISNLTYGSKYESRTLSKILRKKHSSQQSSEICTTTTHLSKAVEVDEAVIDNGYKFVINSKYLPPPPLIPMAYIEHHEVALLWNEQRCVPLSTML